jgi:hypothetical protein
MKRLAVCRKWASQRCQTVLRVTVAEIFSCGKVIPGGRLAAYRELWKNKSALCHF